MDGRVRNVRAKQMSLLPYLDRKSAGKLPIFDMSYLQLRLVLSLWTIYKQHFPQGSKVEELEWLRISL